MTSPKDIILYALGAACLALLIWALVLKAGKANLETENATLVATNAALTDANDTNVQNVKDAATKYSDLVATRKLETKKAAQVANSLEAAQRQARHLTQTAQQLRDKLAAENPNVQDYLRSGPPHPLACSVFPDSPDCKNPVR